MNIWTLQTEQQSEKSETPKKEDREDESPFKDPTVDESDKEMSPMKDLKDLGSKELAR